jgi:hypothetical protein
MCVVHVCVSYEEEDTCVSYMCVCVCVCVCMCVCVPSDGQVLVNIRVHP